MNVTCRVIKPSVGGIFNSLHSSGSISSINASTNVTSNVEGIFRRVNVYKNNGRYHVVWIGIKHGKMAAKTLDSSQISTLQTGMSSLLLGRFSSDIEQHMRRYKQF